MTIWNSSFQVKVSKTWWTCFCCQDLHTVGSSPDLLVRSDRIGSRLKKTDTFVIKIPLLFTQDLATTSESAPITFSVHGATAAPAWWWCMSKRMQEHLFLTERWCLFRRQNNLLIALEGCTSLLPVSMVLAFKLPFPLFHMFFSRVLNYCQVLEQCTVCSILVPFCPREGILPKEDNISLSALCCVLVSMWLDTCFQTCKSF